MNECNSRTRRELSNQVSCIQKHVQLMIVGGSFNFVTTKKTLAKHSCTCLSFSFWHSIHYSLPGWRIICRCTIRPTVLHKYPLLSREFIKSLWIDVHIHISKINLIEEKITPLIKVLPTNHVTNNKREEKSTQSGWDSGNFNHGRTTFAFILKE